MTAMTADLWGTLSVFDHKRPNAFVAEIGLFDALVVPVPPSADAEEWRADRWNGALQAELLDVIPGDKLRRVPWDVTQRGRWAQRREAELASKDVANLQEERRRFVASGRRSVDFDSSASNLSRYVLRDHMNEEKDRALIAGMPDYTVTVIPAFDGPAAYTAAHAEDETVLAAAVLPRQERLLRAFSWEFFVPSDEDRPGKALTHRQLIEAALALDDLPEVREHRRAFRAWTGKEAMQGTEPERAREKMEEMLDRYARAVRGTGISVTTRRACGVVEVGSAAAAVWQPWFGLVGPLMQVFGAREWFDQPPEVPEEIRPAALLHGMRHTFAEAQNAGLALDAEMPLPLTRFWPGRAGLGL